MRTVDLRAGVHYAHRSGGSDRPSRVEVVGPPVEQSVDVFVHVARGPRSRGDRRLSPGSTIRVPVVHLIAAWEDWLASAEGAQDLALPPDSPELLPDRLLHARPERVPDPDRPLPDGYTNLGPLSRRLTGVADLPDHAAAQLSVPPEALARWCTGLPVGVVRDIVGAATRRGFPSSPGSVGAVFSRSGALLAALLARHDNLIDCFPTVATSDSAFAVAHAASAKSVPWELPVPDAALSLWSTLFTGRPPGWLRVGMSAADGSLHRPDCAVTATTFNTAPLWRALLAGPRSCRDCGGAGLVPHPCLLGFVAASEAWLAHGATGVGERWQQEAFGAAADFAAAEQQRTGRPDETDPVALLRGLPPPSEGDRAVIWAPELLAASPAWRRLPDRDKDRVMVAVEASFVRAGKILGVDPPAGGGDRADSARRLRHWLHLLAEGAAVPDSVLAALLDLVPTPPR